MKPKHTTSISRFEALENRLALAGDVNAFAIGTVLHIRGDSEDNGVAVHSTSEGVIEVTGLVRDGLATTINESASQTFTKIKDIVITLNDGDDALVITKLPVSGSISVQLGEGNDVLALGEFDNSGDLVDDIVDDLVGALTVKTSLLIDTGDGDDVIVGRNVSARNFTLATGIGNDSVTFDRNGEPNDNDFIPGVTTSAGLTINMGIGASDVTLDGITVQSLTLTLGDADDELSFKNSTVAKGISIDGRNGANELDIEEITAKNLGISLGLGNDVVSLKSVTTTGKISVSDNFGDDTVTLEDVNAKSFSASLGMGIDTVTMTDVTVANAININTGAGNDTVTLTAIAAKSLSVNLNDGDDTLTFNNVAITKGASNNAGTGNDILVFDGVGAQSLTVVLGDGDDQFSFEQTMIGKKSKIDGGKGTNDYNDTVNNSLGKLTKKNFPA